MGIAFVINSGMIFRYFDIRVSQNTHLKLYKMWGKPAINK
jgi:hypothetical protein